MIGVLSAYINLLAKSQITRESMRLVHLKLLLGVLLLDFDTSVQSTRHEVDHGEDFSNAMELVSNGISTTRKLRHDAPMTTRDHTAETEERTPTENFISRVTEALAAQFPRFDYGIRKIAAKALTMTGSSPSTLFKFLGLDKAGEDLLRNPRYYLWHTTTRFNDPKLTGANLFQVLREYYNDRQLAIAFIQGRLVPITNSVALHSQKLQRRIWVEEEKTSDRVFELLELNQVNQDNFLNNPLVFTWVAFVKDVKENEKNAVDVIAQKLEAMPNFQVEGSEQAKKYAESLLEDSTKYFEKVMVSYD